MPKMSDRSNPNFADCKVFRWMGNPCAGCVCWLLRDHLFDGMYSVQAGLATRIGFYGLFAGLERLPIGPFFSLSPAYISMSRTTLMLFQRRFWSLPDLGVGTKGASSRKVSVRVPHEMTGSLPGQPPFRRWILRLKYSDRDQPERVCQKMEIRNDDSWQ